MACLGVIGDVRVTEGTSAGICSLEWTVPELLSRSAGGKDCYKSPDFDAFGAKWCFIIYPKRRDGDAGRQRVDLFLGRRSESPNQTLHVTVCVKGEDGERNSKGIIQEFSDDEPGCWWHRFCSRYQMEEGASTWMPGGALTLAVEIRRVPLTASARDSSTQTVEEDAELPEHQLSEKRDAAGHDDEAEIAAEECHSAEKRAVEELQTSLHALLREEKICDVVLEVRKKEFFRAHRIILGARSPVFRAMFDHDTLERRRGAVTIEDCNPETFPDLLRHVYTGSVRMVSAENVFGLYLAADKYDLGVLREECSRFLGENVAVDTFCDTIALAVLHGEGELVRRATEFFCRNSLDIVRTVEWQKFLEENAMVANELLIKLLSKHESIFCDTE